MTVTTFRTGRSLPRSKRSRAATIALGLMVGAGASVSSASASVGSRVEEADAELAVATSHVAAGHPRRATRSLGRLRIDLRGAHRSAEALIGRPPKDPESDDPPGPPAILKVLRLDHRVATQLIPTLDHLHGAAVTDAVSVSLALDYRRRDTTIAEVVALPAEGAGDVYTDGMADTLALYSSELTQLAAALAAYQLTSTASATLTSSLDTVRATQSVMESAYGGGE